MTAVISWITSLLILSEGMWSTSPSARAFMHHFPLLPAEEEGRLHDPGLRENFIERVFVLARWREVLAGNADRGDLVEFHSRINTI